MQFNQYSLYSYSADNLKNSCDDKVLIDLHRLKSMKDYLEVKEYVDKTFGTFEGEETTIDYPNNIQVYMKQKENYIAVAGYQDDKQVMGPQWTYRRKEN